MKFRDPSLSVDDFDSDEELTELSLDSQSYDSSLSQQPSPAGSTGDRRAHHNMLERKRRDHIKDSFLSLKDNVPTLTGEKASRTQILRKACDYIETMRDKIDAHNADIALLREQNAKLEAQVRGIEEATKAMKGQPQPRPLPTINPSGHDYLPAKHTGGENLRVIRVSMPSGLLATVPARPTAPLPTPTLPTPTVDAPPPKAPKIEAE